MTQEEDAQMEEEDAEKAQHYENMDEMPYELQKYWHQRYLIFSLYDDGIMFTKSAWFGVTPEPVARKIAAHIALAAPKHKTAIIDAFGGAGGSAIALARSGRWDQVFAIEKDPEVIKCGKRNAEIYGVSKKIWWIQGDCFDVLKARFKGVGKNYVIFASPPWGGPQYTDTTIFDLKKMEPYSIEHIYSNFAKVTKDIVLYLPRNSNLNQLVKYASADREMPIIHYCMKGASKALCAYVGEFSYPLQNGANEAETAIQE
ncbi:putative RNA methylase family protein [Microthyrium microscopicum]|uniref:Trimethylguanosine synthase n=1 Tax=Microthyrium microscopicum TaxID=703497 RepID=A0A6A6TYH8_9PEZI|nr:putative RNA methylase family protein [Microthyrium microscopicum]